MRNVLNPDEMVSVDIGTNLHIVEGASVTVKCRAYGIPDPTIKWFVDNEPVEDKYIITAGDSLGFLKFHQHHSGYYKSQAENEVGQTRAFTDIRVEGNQSIIKDPRQNSLNSITKSREI